jgi:DNA-binding NtrC family response regulator
MAVLFGSVLIAGPKLAAVGSSGSLYRHFKKVLFCSDSRSVPAAISQEFPEWIIVEESSTSASLELLKCVKDKLPACRMVFITEQPGIDSAVGLMTSGAEDYVRGPLSAAELDQLVLSLATKHTSLRRSGLFFHEQCPAGLAFVGQSPGIAQVLETIRIIADSRCNPILITGATGTGKELAAWAVHQWRSGGGRFVGVNCAGLTATLLESELFGHVKGAFTGAERDKTGLLEAAGGGSLFLDEISEMSPDLQAKLLRVLQEKTFRMVGSTVETPCTATIIASSNRNLTEEVRKGAFRQDLYYRLAVFPVALPPLASPQRRDDIDLLANYFIATSKVSAFRGCVRLSQAARQKLREHNWPGNVRELKNVIDRALILNRSEEIPPSSIIIDRPEGQPAAAGGGEDFSLESAERELIIRALRETNWQRTKAAGLLGITRATLHAKIKRYEIQLPDGGAGMPQSECTRTP